MWKNNNKEVTNVINVKNRKNLKIKQKTMVSFVAKRRKN
jgi:hypothetical protein